MSQSDPNQRSKEKTAPRRLPVPGPLTMDKKPEKKLDPSVTVAVISAIVTIVTALLGSPLLLAWVNREPSDSPTGAEMGILQTTTLPTPATDTSNPTLPPTEAGSVDSPSTEVPAQPTLAPVDPTFTATLPPVLPTQPPPAVSWFQCLTVDTWFPTPITLDPTSSDGCWNLNEWGFTTDQGNLFLVHNPDIDQQRGVYLPISGDVKIQFTFQLNEFRVRTNKGSFLHFGIVQDDPFDQYKGGFLSYQQPTPGAGSPVRVSVSGTNQATQNLLILEKGFQHLVQLWVIGDILTVYLNGEPAGEPVTLPPTDRAFWVGYVLSTNAELDVNLTDFTVEKP